MTDSHIALDFLTGGSSVMCVIASTLYAWTNKNIGQNRKWGVMRRTCLAFRLILMASKICSLGLGWTNGVPQFEEFFWNLNLFFLSLFDFIVVVVILLVILLVLCLLSGALKASIQMCSQDINGQDLPIRGRARWRKSRVPSHLSPPSYLDNLQIILKT